MYSPTFYFATKFSHGIWNSFIVAFKLSPLFKLSPSDRCIEVFTTRSKNTYTKLSVRLVDPLTTPNAYWSILKKFLKTKTFLWYLLFFMKINPSQTSKKKLNYLVIFFVNQCSQLSNNSVLLADLPQLTSKHFDLITFSINRIAKNISHLDLNKAHDLDMLIVHNKIMWNFNSLSSFKLKLYLYIRKETNRVWKTLGQYLYSLFVAKFLNVSYIKNSLPFLLRTIWSLQINHNLDLWPHALTSYMLLPTKFINRLMKGLNLERFS